MEDCNMNIKKNLSEGEEIVKVSKASPAPFLIPFVIGLVLIIAGIIMNLVKPHNAYSGYWEIYGLLAIIAGGVICVFALTILEYIISTKIYITNKRVIFNSGIINSVHSEVLLERVSGVTIVEPILGKIFKYGTIIVEANATTVGIRAKYIVEPYEYKTTLSSSIS